MSEKRESRSGLSYLYSRVGGIEKEVRAAVAVAASEPGDGYTPCKKGCKTALGTFTGR